MNIICKVSSTRIWKMRENSNKSSSNAMNLIPKAIIIKEIRIIIHPLSLRIEDIIASLLFNFNISIFSKVNTIEVIEVIICLLSLSK